MELICVQHLLIEYLEKYNFLKIADANSIFVDVNRTVLSNTDLQDCTYEWIPSAASKGGTLIYIDNKLRWPETV